MIKHWSGRLAAISALGLLSLTPAGAEDPPGNLWEMTSQMSMEGMPMKMPPNTVKVCTAREWTRPPPGGDPTCVNSNFQQDGNKVTWTMQCSGQMPMQGTGEITFDGADSYTGIIRATAENMPMTINLSGKKIGTCDNPVG
ncbi:MAG TPA: DUF3617 family protein [Steroidobacteraceae bacterium]|nr:DUF3617 family protein [Steroidobacteraceae bacterium]